MPRKKVESGGKKDQIIEAALELFFSNGYEKTSIRMIQKKVGSEVGLFYYYFKDKDEVFEKALDLFFSRYHNDFRKIVDNCKDLPYGVLNIFFDYMEEEVFKFRQKYDFKMHWTVRRAIREQSLEVIQPYIKEIIDICIEYGATPRVDKDIAVMFLTHGIGGIIIHEEQEQFKAKKLEIENAVHYIMGLNI